MIKFLKNSLVLLSVAFICFLFVNTAEACPTCKDSVEHQWLSLQQGYALSILLMMGMPFSIAAAWTIAIYRMVKKNAVSSIK